MQIYLCNNAKSKLRKYDICFGARKFITRSFSKRLCNWIRQPKYTCLVEFPCYGMFLRYSCRGGCSCSSFQYEISQVWEPTEVSWCSQKRMSLNKVQYCRSIQFCQPFPQNTCVDHLLWYFFSIGQPTYRVQSACDRKSLNQQEQV